VPVAPCRSISRIRLPGMDPWWRRDCGIGSISGRLRELSRLSVSWASCPGKVARPGLSVLRHHPCFVGVSVGIREAMAAVRPHDSRGPVSAVDLPPRRWHSGSRREQSSCQQPGPAPGLGREAEMHGRGALVATTLGSSLHEVAPHREQEGAFEHGVDSPRERDGLAPMVGAGMTHEAVEQIRREHLPITAPCLAAAGRALGAARWVAETAVTHSCSTRMRR